jgi:tRNA (guanine37-N1)-methyltransferase
MPSYDIIGNIAILKFREGTKKAKKLEIAREILKRPSIKTVLEKTDKIKGRLRTHKTKHLLGEKTKIALYKENGCLFKLNIDGCYFSPRLSTERLLIANKIKKIKNIKKKSILIMFAGVAPFPIVISKIAHPKKITAIELGKECCKYALENLKLNKINNIKFIQGDVKRIILKLKEKYDVIVMPRPQLKETFLKQALSVSKKGILIFYYGFAKEEGKKEMIKELQKEAKISKRKIKILDVKKAGELAPYKFRWRIEIKVV